MSLPDELNKHPRPCPAQYAETWRFEDGVELLIRPIRPHDEPLIARFHATLSQQSVRQRYFYFMRLEQRVAHDRLARICSSDYDHEIALVAERTNLAGGAPAILGVGRICRTPGKNEGELAVLVADEFQGHGLGMELSRRLVEIARAEKLERITVDILGENFRMIEVCRSLGFQLQPPAAAVIHGVLTLEKPAQPDCVSGCAKRLIAG